LYPIREGKVVADINPAIRPSFKANGVVIPIPPRGERFQRSLRGRRTFPKIESPFKFATTSNDMVMLTSASVQP